jgi:hypothetical protein
VKHGTESEFEARLSIILVNPFSGEDRHYYCCVGFHGLAPTMRQERVRSALVKSMTTASVKCMCQVFVWDETKTWGPLS